MGIRIGAKNYTPKVGTKNVSKIYAGPNLIWIGGQGQVGIETDDYIYAAGFGSRKIEKYLKSDMSLVSSSDPL